jgi:hypothetical protein
MYYFRFKRLLQTANGRYHVRQTNLNDATQVQPLMFRRWLKIYFVKRRHSHGTVGYSVDLKTAGCGVREPSGNMLCTKIDLITQTTADSRLPL